MFQPRLFKLRCGGGLYVVSGSPKVSNSTIAANGASPSGGNTMTAARNLSSDSARNSQTAAI
jgi:hypothetical protein